MAEDRRKSDAEWRQQLTEEEFYVLRKHGTERAFSHPLNNNKKTGDYVCAGCGNPLFTSDAKYDSGTGWPSFYEPMSEDAVSEHEDRSLFMRRTEVRCAACDGHLGHVFPDGPQPTGQRYCMNGVALKFIEEE
ncbi:MAG: peptide-methionine (R)-S-oxide reductase MsrB [Anderseniella sp.]|nr:peptide-methionine (R)-S-oxide reductase MsrB [Anderseniella sp.]